MAETPTTTPQQAVSFEALQAAAEHIATKTYVNNQIEAAGAAVTFATTEEVVALFQDKTTDPTNPTGGESGGTT